MSEDIGREPCFWSMTPSSNPGYNLVDRERWIVGKDENGKPVRRKEKFPARGHQGDYEDRRPANGTRSILVVRHDGHEAHACLTNAAAHLDPTTPYGQYIMMKSRHLGWFQTHHCPAALVQAGVLDPMTLLDRTIENDSPCARGSYSAESPCKHAVAEKAARQKAHGAAEKEKSDKAKSLAERQTSSQEQATGHFAEALKAQQEANELLRAQLAQQGAVLAKLLEGKSK